MEVNPKDPKTVLSAVVLIAGTLGAGSMLGLTIEPEETTELRVENATLRERTANLEAQVTGLDSRVQMMERIIEQCRTVVENTPQ